tara:strand:- start:147 stop:482 length:336 start_codon:yes stop_codon:yes gene_type:complete
MITIKKNGKTVRLTESEAKNIINKQKIKKFLKESSDGPHKLVIGDEEKVTEMVQKIRNFLIKDNGDMKDFDAGEKSDLGTPLLKVIHAMIKKIKNHSDGKVTERAKKQLEE